MWYNHTDISLRGRAALSYDQEYAGRPPDRKEGPMQLIVKPMGYGDCCVLRQGRALLIADCGSRTNRRASARHGRSASAYAWAAIREELADGPVADLLITRFDPDRFNGFLHLKGARVVQRVYLPHSLYQQRGDAAHALATLALTAPSGSWGWHAARDGAALLARLPQVCGQVLLRRQGQTIRFAGQALKVLWPCAPAAEQLTLFKSEPAGCVCPQWMGAEPEQIDLEYAVRRAVNQIQPGGWARCQQLAGAFAACLESLAQEGAKEAENCRPAAEALTEAMAALLPLREAVQAQAGQRPELAALMEKYAAARRQAWQNRLDEGSLVCALDDRLLLTGDVDQEVLDELRRSGLLEQRYKAVQAPAHGARAMLLPAAGYLIVSNGYRKGWGVRAALVRSAAGRVVCTRAYKEAGCCEYMARRACPKKCIRMGDCFKLELGAEPGRRKTKR